MMEGTFSQPHSLCSTEVENTLVNEADGVIARLKSLEGVLVDVTTVRSTCNPLLLQ